MITAYHGEPLLKEKVIERMLEHRRMDRITQGVYWKDNKGCLLGCLTHANENTHKVAERLFGIELRVGFWIESVFEGLPKDKCEWWVIESLKSIPCGADLSQCHHHFGYWLLGSDLLTITDDNRDAITTVRHLHKRTIDGLPVTTTQWSAAWSARSAARSTAESARSAARSTAESAAWSAESAAWSADSAAWSARSAARSTAESARSADSAAWSARSAAWQQIAEKTLEIFAAAPVISQVKQECTECVEQAWSVLNNDGSMFLVTGEMK